VEENRQDRLARQKAKREAGSDQRGGVGFPPNPPRRGADRIAKLKERQQTFRGKKKGEKKINRKRDSFLKT